jgi:hypothetical protein
MPDNRERGARPLGGVAPHALSPIRTVTVGPGIAPSLLTLNVAEALAGFEA